MTCSLQNTAAAREALKQASKEALKVEKEVARAEKEAQLRAEKEAAKAEKEVVKAAKEAEREQQRQEREVRQEAFRTFGLCSAENPFKKCDITPSGLQGRVVRDATPRSSC